MVVVEWVPGRPNPCLSLTRSHSQIEYIRPDRPACASGLKTEPNVLTLLTYARAFAVHVLTATGAALALVALLAAVRGAFDLMFLCLGIALIVDGIDGTIARALKVAELLPRWSGDVLDLVVDFVTYVFVPAYAIAASGLLPPWLGAPAGVLIVM